MEHSNQAVAGSPVTLPGSSTSGPFVINLCASAAPLEFKATGLPGLERYRLYQVRRIEDSRPRYRLRLGFFVSQAAAEAVLSAVRDYYPAAFSIQAGSDDLKHAPVFEPSKPAPARMQAAPRGKPLPVADKAPSPTSTPASSIPTNRVRAMDKQPASQEPVPVIELLPDPAPPQAVSSPPAAVAAPFRIQPADPAALRHTPADLSLELPAALSTQSSALRPPNITNEPVLIDSTQTLRLLTEAELADTQGPQWFAVELAVSEQVINLDTMPKLDIFLAFRLYSIATQIRGKIQYSLRLGFFREAVSAEAVAGYLKTFFTTPEVLRVSAAEQTRFATPPTTPVLTQPATSPQKKVVPLNEARQRSAKPAAPALAAAGRVTETVKKAPPPRTVAATAVARKSAAVPSKQPANRNRSLNELLREEARQIALSESGIRNLEQKRSLLSRLVGKLTR